MHIYYWGLGVGMHVLDNSYYASYSYTDHFWLYNLSLKQSLLRDSQFSTNQIIYIFDYQRLLRDLTLDRGATQFTSTYEHILSNWARAKTPLFERPLVLVTSFERNLTVPLRKNTTPKTNIPCSPCEHTTVQAVLGWPFRVHLSPLGSQRDLAPDLRTLAIGAELIICDENPLYIQ